jgi:type II secretory ATPase GspE/PulE/Tfp pilus assembly ATPase PilB-like protein
MVPLAADGAEKVRAGLTSMEEISRATLDT